MSKPIVDMIASNGVPVRASTITGFPEVMAWLAIPEDASFDSKKLRELIYRLEHLLSLMGD